MEGGGVMVRWRVEGKGEMAVEVGGVRAVRFNCESLLGGR